MNVAFNQKNLPKTLAPLFGAGLAFYIEKIASDIKAPIVVITTDSLHAANLLEEITFFKSNPHIPLDIFPDWETLPYDQFSPHPDLVSTRLRLCHDLPQWQKGILIVPISHLLQKILPRAYLEENTFIFRLKDRCNLDKLRERLARNNYYCVSKVLQSGEFCVRGSIIDIFPSGSQWPIRIELFDDEIESLRYFNPEDQRSTHKLEKFELLPAREYPLTEKAIAQFRQAWRSQFEGNPLHCPIYQEISQGLPAAGVEYYLPLFYEKTASLFDYLPENTVYLTLPGIYEKAQAFVHEFKERYEQRAHDITKPILKPRELILGTEDLFAILKTKSPIQLFPGAYPSEIQNIDLSPLPTLTINNSKTPLSALESFLLTNKEKRVLFCANSKGRENVLSDLLRDQGIKVTAANHWKDFLNQSYPYQITVGQLNEGLILNPENCVLVTEADLFGAQVVQSRRRKTSSQDATLFIQNLAELKIGDKIVHLDYGIGRYEGLTTLETGGIIAEYLTLAYQGSDKIYVPITSLDRISRYSGADPDKITLAKLGQSQWQKARNKALEKIRDVAAELLSLYAKREAQKGSAFPLPGPDYHQFVAGFPFEETADQARAIEDVIQDMTQEKCMDRLICGDVGFGKTEVAMRAAFIAVNAGKQVLILVPTTLLANQHYENFKDRFAGFAINIHLISRFRTNKEQEKTLEGLKTGQVDIVIGTHKLLGNIEYRELGLLIIDEEHRFGVKQKEALKAYRSHIDILTLTATPIPRTLNMSLNGLRDISLIATPPAKRLSIKTFAQEYRPQYIRESILREILRGGQVYFLHNDIDTIEKMAHDLQTLVPEAKIITAHGQMGERTLEKVMSDFYHHRFNVLICTTIIETGIDIPTANTIIINKAERFGIAQLHQLRGRVGRSHHQAYAYLIIPPQKAMTQDAQKRLEAFLSLEDLGAGFTLATHDLEIRGAGELLGEEQSGHMEAIGYSLYRDLLTRTVDALKKGEELDLEHPFGSELNLQLNIPALIPEAYVYDVQLRLVLYKKIASCQNESDIQDIQIELVDRFGPLPDPLKYLLKTTLLKKHAQELGIKRIEFGKEGGFIEFTPKPKINSQAIITLIQDKNRSIRLDGPNKLRFHHIEQNPEERLRWVDNLFHHLRP